MHNLSSPALVLALAGIGFASGVQAQTTTTPGDRFEQRVDQRQARQEQRIDNGVTSGTLTVRETARLERQQAGVERAETRAQADGKLTRREAYRIEQRQDAASRSIWRQKHDRQSRG